MKVCSHPCTLSLSPLLFLLFISSRVPGPRAMGAACSRRAGTAPSAEAELGAEAERKPREAVRWNQLVSRVRILQIRRRSWWALGRLLSTYWPLQTLHVRVLRRRWHDLGEDLKKYTAIPNRPVHQPKWRSETNRKSGGPQKI